VTLKTFLIVADMILFPTFLIVLWLMARDSWRLTEEEKQSDLERFEQWKKENMIYMDWDKKGPPPLPKK
jgi:hypothetical protein